MKQVTVTLNVDESAIMQAVEGTGANTLDAAISQELGWLQDSGMFVEKWSYDGPERSKEQQLVDQVLCYLGEHLDSSELYSILHDDLEMTHEDIALLGFDLPQCYEEKTGNTKILYLYRDASNYKVYNECVVPGVLTEDQKKTMLDSLEDGEYFVPSVVGLPEKRFDTWTEDDGIWFELGPDSFEETTEEATVSFDTAALAAAFASCKGRWAEQIFSNLFNTPGFDKVYGLVAKARLSEPVDTKALEDIRDTYGMDLYKSALDTVLANAEARARTTPPQNNTSVDKDHTEEGR